MHQYLHLCPPDSSGLLHSLYIVWWKHGCPCTAVCLCPSHLNSVPTLCLECLHASIHVLMSIWLPILAWPPLHSYIETWVPQCGGVCVYQLHHFWYHTLFRDVHVSVHVFISTQLPMLAQSSMDSYMETWVPLCCSVCVSQSAYFWSHTLFRMCTCISTCIYVHPTAHVISTHYGLVTREPGCPCEAVCVCPSQPTSGHTPCLECVHASVYVFMLTCLPMLAKAPMETWVPVCVTVCLSQSPFFWSHTLFRMCTCISTCIMWTWVQNSDTPLLHSYIETRVPQCGGVCVYQSHHFWSHTLFRMCTFISACIYVHLTPCGS